MTDLSEIPSTVPPLIRLDGDEDEAWRLLKEDLALQTMLSKEDADVQVVTVVDDLQLYDCDPGELLEVVSYDKTLEGIWDFCFLADKTTLKTPGFPLLAMSVNRNAHTFRVNARNVAEVVFPVSMGTMGWEQFTNLDDAGVWRSLIE